MENLEFRTFPRNLYEALTMLYLKNLDISLLTPGELLDKYVEVYTAIHEHDKQRGKEKR